MPPQKDTTTEEEYPPHSGAQGPSRTSLTGHTYPDPTSLGTHTNPTLPDSAWNDMSLTEPHHGMIHYHQSQATFLMTNTWGGNGVSPYAANMPDDGITLDPSLRANDFWNRHALEFNQPIFQAGPWGNQYIGPSFRGTNMPAQGTNRFTEDRTSFPYYTPIASKHYIPPPAGAVENAESCTGNGKRKCRESTSDAHRHEDLGQSVHEDQHSMQKQMISTRPKKAAGGNHSAQARYRVVNNEKLVLVGDDWKRAGHHRDFRVKLIMMDGEQPGAPVFEEGMSSDYTSYSPVTCNWTDDPRSITDSEGQEVMFLPARPPHLPHNPECDFLMCEGLIMLDQDDKPVKAYPGAPRTLASDVIQSPGYLLQGLRSILGMTVEDLRARMLVEKDLEAGKTRSQGVTALTNRTNFWRWHHNLPAWHHRRTRDMTKTKGTIPSGRSKKGETATVPIPNLSFEPMEVLHSSGPESVEWNDFDD